MSTSPKLHLKQAALDRVRWVGHLLDNAIAIPGTRFRFGLDPILSLVPGAGDWLSAVLSVYIVLESLRFGLPGQSLLQMLANVLVDALTGMVPVLGDLFDVTWKANHRNVRLLEEHIQNPRSLHWGDRLVAFFVVVVLVAFLVAVSSLAWFVLSSVIGFLN
jgi:hypothetical protein